MGSPRYSRRLILQSGTAVAADALCASQLGAGALAQDTSRDLPGVAHHRFSLGARDIFVLSDGHLVVPTSMLAGNVPQTELRSFLATSRVGPERVHFHINVALVKSGNEYVLIDAGSGEHGNRLRAGSPTAWRLPASARRRSAGWC